MHLGIDKQYLSNTVPSTMECHRYNLRYYTDTYYCCIIFYLFVCLFGIPSPTNIYNVFILIKSVKTYSTIFKRNKLALSVCVFQSQYFNIAVLLLDFLEFFDNFLDFHFALNFIVLWHYCHYLQFSTHSRSCQITVRRSVGQEL